MSYSFTPLAYPGVTQVKALGINEGIIVGTYVINNFTSGFLALDGGQPSAVLDPLHTATYALSINDSLQIVGYGLANNGVADGFLEDRGHVATIDDPLGAGGGTFPQDIAENGQIVGYYIDSNKIDHGFIYSNSVFTTLDDPSGALGTVATGVNNPGQVVGYYFDAANHAHGFLLAGGSFATLDDPSATNGTFAEGIDETGRIVGYYLDANNLQHGFVYADGTFTTVDAPAGTGGTVIRESNDPGQLVGDYFDANGTEHGFVADPDIVAFDTDTKQNIVSNDMAYSGPVPGLQHQYIYTGTDDVNVIVSDGGWFLHGGPGADAFQASSGYNVLDGGTGSNFLTGGSGTDTFFVDDRNPSSDIWSTMNSFHRGGDATLFGITSTANIQWFDNEGAAGFTGLTLHVFTPNRPTASLTLPRYSLSDLSNGRLTVQFGSESDGTPFMHILAS